MKRTHQGSRVERTGRVNPKAWLREANCGKDQRLGVEVVSLPEDYLLKVLRKSFKFLFLYNNHLSFLIYYLLSIVHRNNLLVIILCRVSNKSVSQ
jgi:hypothetical protein